MTGGRWRGRRAVVLAAAGAATLGLLFVSRGKWSDPLIDSGREWIVPDALSRGELLYRDVVYWFGPFTPYFQAFFLRLLGSSLLSLVLAGAAAGAGALAVLHAALRRVAGRRDAIAWTVLAIPALLLMPNGGGVLLGMGYRIWHAAAFALAAVVIASGSSRRRRAVWMLAAGGCAGAAGLCRTEWGVAVILAACLAAIIRPRSRRRGLAEAAAAAAGFAAVFGGGLTLFLLWAGPGAVLRDGHVLLTGLPEETRHFLLVFSGVADWRRGFLELLYSAAMWTGLFLAVSRIARPSGAAPERGADASLVIVLLLLVAIAAAGGAGAAVLFSASPLAGLAALGVGLRRGRGSQAAALAACGFLGLVLSYRRPFHIGDSAYVGPPLLFAFVAAAGLLRIAAARRRLGPSRRRLAGALRWTIAALAAVAFLGRAWHYASIDSVPIAGTGGMLSARPEIAREIERLGGAIRHETREGDGLVVFPEGEILNLLSGRPNPIRHKLYVPGYLTEANEAMVLAELERASPAAIVIWRRLTSEYGRGSFGEDYGRGVRAWIEENYRVAPFRVEGAPFQLYPRFLLAVRRDAR